MLWLFILGGLLAIVLAAVLVGKAIDLGDPE